MKREILFRGKCVDQSDGSWIYGDLRKWTNGKFAIISSENTRDSVAGVEVDPYSIGQFTGKSICDKKLFEGDLVRIETKHTKSSIFQVYWCNNMAEFRLFSSKCADADGWGKLSRMFDLIDDFQADSEIIGNIFDNPEMVKE